MDWLSLLPSVGVPAASFVALIGVPVVFKMGISELQRRGMNTTVIEAVGRAAGTAYLQLAAKGQPVTSAAAVAVATQVGVDYLNQRIPDTLKAAGINGQAAVSMVQAELGKLLAADPSVSVALPKDAAPLPTPSMMQPPGPPISVEAAQARLTL